MDKGQRNTEKKREEGKKESGPRKRSARGRTEREGGPVKRAKRMNRVQEHPRAGRLAIQCKLADFSELRHYSSNVNTAI